MDGRWARATNQVTDLGKILDPVADKVLVYGILTCFCCAYSWFVVILVIICVRDFVVDALRTDSAKKGVVIAASFLGKSKTFTQMTAIVLILLGRIIILIPQAWILCLAPLA